MKPLTELFDTLKTRWRWWKAETYGERPVCGTDGCDNDAVFHLRPEGYRCLMCYHRGVPYTGVGTMRDIEPEDYYND